MEQLYRKVANLLEHRAFQYVILIVITLVAAALRFYKLGEWSFGGDEVITVNAAWHAFDGSFVPSYVPGRGMSLLLIGSALTALGTNEWSARLAPAVVGVLTVPILYFPIRRAFNPTVAIVAVALLAVSMWHLQYSQNARYVSMLVLFYSLALLLFYLALEEDRVLYLVASMLFFGLAIWERLFAAFFVPVVVMYVVLLTLLPFKKPPGLRWRNFVLVALPAIVLGSLFGWKFILQPSLWMDAFGDWDRLNPLSVFWQFILVVRLPMIGIGVVAVVYLLLQRHRGSLLMGLGAGIPLLTIMIASLFQGVDVRYAIVSLICWAILAAVGFSELLFHSPKKAKILVVGILVLLLSDPLMHNIAYYRYENGARPDWKVAFELVRQKREPGDLIASNTPHMGIYYLGEEVAGTESIDAQVEFDKKVQSGDRVWLVASKNMRRIDPPLQNWMEGSCQVIHDQFSILVYLCRPVAERFAGG